MNEHIHEELSALMDGELDRERSRFLLKRLATDAELPARWSRYHSARDALRRQTVTPVPAGFADAVMSRIDAEPLARSRGQAPWLRWGAGGAIAASVAVAALVVSRPAETPGLAPAQRTASLQAAPLNVAPVAATVSTTDFRPPLLAPNPPIETAPVNFGSDLSQPLAGDPRLQSYLSRHYQAVGGGGQSAFVPYVLLAAPQRAGTAASSGDTPPPQNR